MSEWWTYSLTSFLLFSPRTYYRLFELYNAAVWPLQVVTLALGLAILVVFWRPPAWSGRAIVTILAALWLVVAWAYHLERYDPINFAATYYAIGFAIQAALLVWVGVVRDGLKFQSPFIPAKAGIQNPKLSMSNSKNWTPAFRLRSRFGGQIPKPVEAAWRRRGAGVSGVQGMGLALLLYALILHPLLPLAVGRPIAQAEVFGLAPDPTAMATLGVILAASRPHWALLALPVLWCVITALTLWTMEQSEAAAPLAAAILAVAGMAWKSRRPRGLPPADG